MPDEIDLLRGFRADTPEPDEAAWNRARTALAGARAGEPGAQSALARHRSRWRLPSRRLIITTAAAMVAVAGGAVTAIVLQPPPSLSRPLITSWQPARPLPGRAPSAHAPAGTWQLTGYLVARGWQRNTAGPEPGLLTCPTAATCYVEGDNSTSPTGPVDMNSLYVSSDGAQTWSVLPVPGNVTFTSALSCASATSCAAGGLYYGHQPVYLTTANGGHSWTVRPLPADAGQILDLDCTTTATCRGLASAAAQPPVWMSLGGLIFDAHFIVASDGGRRFTISAFPRGESIQGVACPTASHCVAVGLYSKYSPRNGPDLNHGVLLTSDDGGQTWQQRPWPSGYGLEFPDITCVDASHCAMIGFVERNGTVRDQDGGVTSGKDAVQYSVIAFSADGGATWRTSTLPHTIPYPVISSLACPTTMICYGAGGASSSVVAITHDAGRTWQLVTFPAPAKVPGGMQGDSFMDIGQIECPSPDACIAIGVSDQGSTSTPIYTYRG